MCNTVIYPLLPHHHHQHGVQQGPHRKSCRVRELVRIDLLPPRQAMGYSSKTPPSGAGTPARSKINPTPTPPSTSATSHPVRNDIPCCSVSTTPGQQTFARPSTTQVAAPPCSSDTPRSSPFADPSASAAKFEPRPSATQAAASLSRHTPARSSPATDDPSSAAGDPGGASTTTSNTKGSSSNHLLVVVDAWCLRPQEVQARRSASTR